MPSVTREGYEILVTSKPPPVWVNPVGKAFCQWLNVKLNGPGSSAPAQVLFHETLEQVLCDIITDPCANFCANGNDLLLLATATFNNDGTLGNIDNVTGRRLVISTGAILEALMCLTRAEITCCAATDAYLTLAATVAPTTVNLAAQPVVNSLSYTLTVTNSDAHKDSESFDLSLAFPSGALTFQSATLTIAGTAAPAPSGDSTGVKAVISKLPAGAIAQLVVTATFDPTAHKAGDTLASTASIADYVGGHGPDVTLTTSFISQTTDGPRVVTANLVMSAGVNLVPMLQKGITLPFTEAMDPSSAVPTTVSSAGSIVQGTVTLVLTYASLTHVPPPITFSCKLSWNATNDQLAIAADGELPPSGTSQWLANAKITLTAGPKGGTFTGPALRNAASTARLDGWPSFPPGTDTSGESGDGTQGGDFVYTITGGH
jgi:hypothetical protein